MAATHVTRTSVKKKSRPPSRSSTTTLDAARRAWVGGAPYADDRAHAQASCEGGNDDAAGRGHMRTEGRCAQSTQRPGAPTCRTSSRTRPPEPGPAAPTAPAAPVRQQDRLQPVAARVRGVSTRASGPPMTHLHPGIVIEHLEEALEAQEAALEALEQYLDHGVAAAFHLRALGDAQRRRRRSARRRIASAWPAWRGDARARRCVPGAQPCARGTG